MTYLGFSGLESEKAVLKSEMEFAEFQSFAKNAKKSKFWPKMPYLRFCGLESEINCFHIWNQYPQIFSIKKFCGKKYIYPILEQKIPSLGILKLEILKS